MVPAAKFQLVPLQLLTEIRTPGFHPVAAADFGTYTGYAKMHVHVPRTTSVLRLALWLTLAYIAAFVTYQIAVALGAG